MRKLLTDFLYYLRQGYRLKTAWHLAKNTL